MSLLLRAAVLGGIAYFVTRSMRGKARRQSLTSSGSDMDSGSFDSGMRKNELHPGEDNMWPTSESQSRSPAHAGPGA